MKTQSRQSEQGGILKVFCVLLLAGWVFLLLVGSVIYLSVRPDRVFRDLEGDVLNALAEGPRVRVAVRAPSGLVSLARFGLSFIDEIDQEGRLAIEAIRGGQVGIYPLSRPVSRADRPRMMRRADAAMRGHHWERVAAVAERDEMVLVYVPGTLEDAGELEAFTVVVSRDQMVIASLRGDLQPVYQIVQAHLFR